MIHRYANIWHVTVPFKENTVAGEDMHVHTCLLPVSPYPLLLSHVSSGLHPLLLSVNGCLAGPWLQ